MSFVLDASSALAWCFDGEATPASDALLDRTEAEDVAVPSIWPLEIANALAIAERRHRISPAQIAEYLALLDGLTLTIDPPSLKRAFVEIRGLARSESLSAYDAAYLDLAMREGLPLATRDQALLDAAHRLGVAVIAA